MNIAARVLSWTQIRGVAVEAVNQILRSWGSDFDPLEKPHTTPD